MTRSNGIFSAGALFAGIGGFCLGFDQAGIKTRWAIEKDRFAADSYRKNVGDVRLIMDGGLPADIRSVKVSSSNLEPVDVIHAGFPCQSFSQAGERKGFEDPRGRLFYEIIRVVKEFKDRKPAVIVLENAPYLRSGQGGAWFMEISKEIKKAGYWFRDSNAAELDAYELTALPQKRNRLFMVAFSIDHFRSGKFTFPNARHDAPKSLGDFVAFDGSLEDDSYYLSPDNRYYSMIQEQIKDRRRIYQLRKYFVRVKEPNVCPTLTANMGLGGHNVPFIYDAKGLRKLTEQECLRLQGFTEFSFPESVPRAKRYVQIGNSVAVPVAALLGHAIRQKFEKEYN